MTMKQAQPLLQETNREPVARTAALLAIASVLAIGFNEVIAVTAQHSGAGHQFAPLNLPVFAAFTVGGTLAGWVGWRTISRRARRPKSTLTVLVPLVAVISFAPDVGLLALHFIPDTTTAGVVALMAMHVVVIIIAIPTYILASRGPNRSTRTR